MSSVTVHVLVDASDKQDVFWYSTCVGRRQWAQNWTKDSGKWNVANRNKHKVIALWTQVRVFSRVNTGQDSEYFHRKWESDIIV